MTRIWRAPRRRARRSARRPGRRACGVTSSRTSSGTRPRSCCPKHFRTRGACAPAVVSVHTESRLFSFRHRGSGRVATRRALTSSSSRAQVLPRRNPGGARLEGHVQVLDEPEAQLVHVERESARRRYARFTAPPRDSDLSRERFRIAPNARRDRLGLTRASPRLTCPSRPLATSQRSTTPASSPHGISIGAPPSGCVSRPRLSSRASLAARRPGANNALRGARASRANQICDDAGPAFFSSFWKRRFFLF